MTQELWWYTARATGLVAWAAVTASIVWGLLLSARVLHRPRAAWALDLHRYLGALALALVALHVVAIAFDQWIGFDWDELLVPYASAWRPAAVAWGIVGMYLLGAVETTSLLMRWISRPLWHTVHLLGFVVFAAVTAHALMAGTDAHEPAMLGFAIASIAVVGLLLALRLAQAIRRHAVPGSGSGSGPVPLRGLHAPSGAGTRSS